MTNEKNTSCMGVTVPSIPLEDGETATNVMIVARTERLHADGRIEERYVWTSSAAPLAMQIGMADILADFVNSDQEES
jgi:hypothetical protein